ncbi:MAG: hypothetical protein JNL70_24010 [Saprospiraceae bacterium]|nr:hypothetical protein [Saprospiraceae bacterium]
MRNILKGSLFLAALSLSTTSCDLFKKAETSSKPPTKKNDQTNNQGQTNPNAGTVLVDTIRWKSDPKAKPPITTQTQSGTSQPNNGGIIVDGGSTNGNGGVVTDSKSYGTIKNSYDLALLLPFFTSQYTEGGANPSKSQFALDFYAGVKIALDSLSTQPFNLRVNVIDSKADFNGLLARYDVSRADVLLGPVEKENVPATMDFANRRQKIFVSPYFPTGDVEGANPFFIQVKPSLKTHCENIVRHLKTRYKTDQVVLVGRRMDNETSRFKLFQDANSTYNQTNYGGRFDEWAIDNETNFSVEPYIHQSGQTVFVVPSWNEAFVSTLLQKIAASPRRGNVTVYGMPQWMDFNKSLTSLYQSLGVRVSSSTFVDGSNENVKYFRAKFFNKFSKMPNSDSFLGYDCMMYIGKMLQQYGTTFPQYLQNEPESVLHTRFNFAPIYRTVVNDSDMKSNVAKYENQFVNMLRYQNGSFRLDE